MSTATRPVFPSRNSQLPGAVVPKVQTWQGDPEAVGLDAGRVAALQAANDAAAAAQQQLEAARQTTERATSVFNNACNTVRQLAGQCVRSIDAFALASGDPNAVWELAAVPALRPRGAGKSPAQPRAFTAGLNGNGSLTVKWKCSNPRGVSGVVYQVSRRLNNTGPFSVLDTVGGKQFVDGSIPAGTFAVTYKVVGKRGQRVGPVSDQFTVQFGAAGLSIADSFTGGTLAA